MGDSLPNKPRNRRVEAAKKRSKQRRVEAVGAAKSKIGVFFSLLLLGVFVLVATGLLYAAFLFDAEDLRRFNGAYKVVKKERIEGQLIDASPPEDSPSKGFSQRVDPQYHLICIADLTRSEYVFAAPEEVFYETPVNTVLPASETSDWELVSFEEVSLKEVLANKLGLNDDQ